MSSNGLRRGSDRAVTFPGASRTPALLSGAGAADPFLEDMKKGVNFEGTNILDQFRFLNRELEIFCRACAEHAGRSKRLPPRDVCSAPVTSRSPVGGLASEFSSISDYAFFSLISIVNNHLGDCIFRPFHPFGSSSENNRYGAEYERRVSTGATFTAWY